MRATDVIMKKRGSVLNPKGEKLSREEIAFLIEKHKFGLLNLLTICFN